MSTSLYGLRVAWRLRPEEIEAQIKVTISGLTSGYRSTDRRTSANDALGMRTVVVVNAPVLAPVIGRYEVGYLANAVFGTYICLQVFFPHCHRDTLPCLLSRGANVQLFVWLILVANPSDCIYKLKKDNAARHEFS